MKTYNYDKEYVYWTDGKNKFGQSFASTKKSRKLAILKLKRKEFKY